MGCDNRSLHYFSVSNTCNKYRLYCIAHSKGYKSFEFLQRSRTMEPPLWKYPQIRRYYITYSDKGSF